MQVHRVLRLWPRAAVAEVAEEEEEEEEEFARWLQRRAGPYMTRCGAPLKNTIYISIYICYIYDAIYIYNFF